MILAVELPLSGLSSMIDDVLRAWDSVDDLQEQAMTVTGKGQSDDGLITATVGPRGHLVDLAIDPRALRRPDAKAIAAQIVAATTRAVHEANRQTSEIVSGALPADLSLDRLGSGVQPLFGGHDADLLGRRARRDA